MLTFEQAFRAFIVAFEAERDFQRRCCVESGLDVMMGVYLSHLRDVASSALFDVAKFADLRHR